LFLAFTALRGEMGYPSAISAPTWGFEDVSFGKKPLVINQRYATYTMENILFKISFPAEFHAQTAVEAAVSLHPEVINRIDDIERIVIKTQESGDRIINKTGPLDNPADRDHCIQYMVAIGLLKGDLQAEHYEDNVATDPRVDALRERMEVSEEERFSREYLEADKRAIGNSLQIFYGDGSCSEEVVVDYPVGHRRRRDEGIPLLKAKFERYLRGHINSKKADQILAICADQQGFENTSVTRMMELLQH
jgi:2-methylcitrate dehydratase